MTTAMQIGKTARNRADFCRCLKTGAAVFLHDDGIVAHSTYRNTLRAAYMLAGTNGDTSVGKLLAQPDLTMVGLLTLRLRQRCKLWIAGPLEERGSGQGLGAQKP